MEFLPTPIKMNWLKNTQNLLVKGLLSTNIDMLVCYDLISYSISTQKLKNHRPIFVQDLTDYLTTKKKQIESAGILPALWNHWWFQRVVKQWDTVPGATKHLMLNWRQKTQLGGYNLLQQDSAEDFNNHYAEISTTSNYIEPAYAEAGPDLPELPSLESSSTWEE